MCKECHATRAGTSREPKTTAMVREREMERAREGRKQGMQVLKRDRYEEDREQ